MRRTGITTARDDGDRVRGWRTVQATIETALEEMALPAGYWHHSLPGVVQHWMRRATGAPVRSRRLDQFDALLARLDREAPRWRDRAAAFLLSPAAAEAMALWRPVAALLAARRVEGAAGLVDFVRQWADALTAHTDFPWADKYRGAQCVLALMGTDTTETLDLWRTSLGRLCEAPGGWRCQPMCGADAALFLMFLKLLQHRLLSYDEFACAATTGGALRPEHYSGRRARPPYYQPVLDYLGLSASRYFRLMYQRLAHEAMDRERAGRWEDIWWLRMLSGRDYFLTGLERLDSDPIDLHALQAVKWGFDFGDRQGLARRLAPFSRDTLATISLVRQDLDLEVGAALEVAYHPEAMRWLRSSTAAAWRGAVQQPQWLVDWCVRAGEAVTDAVERLWLLGLPPKPSPRLIEALRAEMSNASAYAEAERYALVEEFVCEHLCTDFGHISHNLDYADALAGRDQEALIRRAREDTVTAMRALALCRGDEAERVAVLLAAKRRGNRMIRAAAQEALDLIARQHGLADASELERREELALAWSDAGLDGQHSRVWWAVGDYRVRLSAANGKVTITAYGRRGPLKGIPQGVRRHPDFAEIAQVRRELTQQYAEFRKRLEEAMVTQRAYSPAELRMLRANLVFADLVSRLVLSVGTETQLGSEECAAEARIAHPAQLLEAGTLEAWQHRIVDEMIVQPLKQCFREVYRPLPDEAGAEACARFAGHQVLVPRAFALLRSRGWAPGRGEARRDWPQAAMQAHFTWGRDRPRLDYHLAENGRQEPVVTGDIRFHRLGADGRPAGALTIAQVPPIIFSETLRDADLVVSLATAGELGFSSEQTVQLRLALVRQLARIMRLSNVAGPEAGSYVVVSGRLATYRVHLGSASIFLEPTGAHLPAPRDDRPAPDYLPFEEVDSRTAEVLRVIVALSRDAEIKDERFRECVARLTQSTR